MPKKNTSSRSGTQKARTKPKSFELVRPVSDDNVLEMVNSSDEIEEVEVVEVVEEGDGEEEETEDEEKVEVPASRKANVQVVKRPSVKESVLPVAVASTVSSEPKSASARLAARRKAGPREKASRPAVSLILAENYAYVRKDLIFILLLAVIMFIAIIIMHFIPAIGG